MAVERWEYLAIQVDHRPSHSELVRGVRLDRFDAVETVLNELATQGWEAIAVEAPAAWRLLLKRRAVGD